MSSRLGGLFLVVSLIAYILPWVNTRATGLTLGAYDLAEWASLHPASIQLLPSLLIRLQLVIITIIFLNDRKKLQHHLLYFGYISYS